MQSQMIQDLTCAYAKLHNNDTRCFLYLQYFPPRCGLCDPGPHSVAYDCCLSCCEHNQQHKCYECFIVACPYLRTHKGQRLNMSNNLYGACYQPCEVHSPIPAETERGFCHLSFVTLLASVQQSKPTDRLHACAVHDSMHKAPQIVENNIVLKISVFC